MSTWIVPQPKTLAIALGANLPSAYGSPTSTLIAARGLLEKIVCEWIKSSLKENTNLNEISTGINWRWSPLFETEPLGGPTNQPKFINAAVLINGSAMESIDPSEQAILNLLEKTLMIENALGRERKNDSSTWGPRTIDIDLLAWGDLQVKTQKLILPHPRIFERSFVLTPLAAALTIKSKAPKKLAPQKGWSE